jgi:hypothetical protein
VSGFEGFGMFLKVLRKLGILGSFSGIWDGFVVEDFRDWKI